GGLPVHTASARASFVLASIKGLGRRPAPAAICSIDRPEAAERSSRSNASASPGLALESRCLISSQLVLLPPYRSPRIRTRTQLPVSRLPSSVNLRSPDSRASSVDFVPSGVQKPRSQSCTVPPPYSP